MAKNKPYDLPELFGSFVFMPRFEDSVEALKNLAEPEDWDYKNTESKHQNPVLRN